MALLEFAALAAMCAPNVDVGTLEAIVTHESRANVYAIGVNSKDYRLPRQPKTLDEAVSTANFLIKEGYDFDSGLGQINVRNLDWLGISIEEVFDPCINLQAAAKVLTDCYVRAVPKFGEGQQSLQAALSCYNTGNFERGFKNNYVNNVLAQVGAQVPALKPKLNSEDKATPFVLQKTSTENIAVNTVKAKSIPQKREGIDDAFGSIVNDAFNEDM